jgi:hypothetical protein
MNGNTENIKPIRVMAFGLKIKIKKFKKLTLMFLARN